MKHTIITGHYGTGKTNIAINMALDEAKKGGKKVYLIDADIVNPYFRSSDNREILEKNGVFLIAPVYANTNLDIPSMPPEVGRVFADDCIVFWDIGGDDTGAVVLGRYSEQIKNQGYEMLYVINFYRPMTEISEDMLTFLREIEQASHLHAAYYINNSNLGPETKAEDIIKILNEGKKFEEKSLLALKFLSVSTKNIFMDIKNIGYPVRLINIYTKLYW